MLENAPQDHGGGGHKKKMRSSLLCALVGHSSENFRNQQARIRFHCWQREPRSTTDASTTQDHRKPERRWALVLCMGRGCGRRGAWLGDVGGGVGWGGVAGEGWGGVGGVGGGECITFYNALYITRKPGPTLLEALLAKLVLQVLAQKKRHAEWT